MALGRFWSASLLLSVGAVFANACGGGREYNPGVQTGGSGAGGAASTGGATSPGAAGDAGAGTTSGGVSNPGGAGEGGTAGAVEAGAGGEVRGGTSSTGGTQNRGGSQGLGGEVLNEAGASGAPVCNQTEHANAATIDWTHQASCSDLTPSTNPPMGGPHYDTWAAYGVYTFPVPKGFLIHDMEHGGIVVWYNCPDGCSREVAAATAWLDALPEDPLCAGSPALRRVVLTPAPDLPTRWAISAAKASITSDCFDSARFRQFYLDHFGKGPENTCSAGSSFTTSPCE